MSDTPKVGQYWGYSNVVSTITGVEGTQSLGSQSVNHVASDKMTDSVNTIGWSFARGVGITSLSYNGQSLNISSFYVNTQTSQSELRAPASIRPSEVRFVSAGEAAALLKALF